MSKVALTLVVLGLVACSGGDPQEATPTGAAGTEASGGTGGSSGSGSGGSEAGGAAGSEASAGEAGAAGGPTPGCSSNADCADAAGTPRCDLESGQCVEPPAGHLIGWGDGSASSVDLTLILDPTTKREATDLAFHPTRTGLAHRVVQG